MRVTNFGAAAAEAAAAELEDEDDDDEPELLEELGLVPGGGASGVEAPSNSRRTVPSTIGRGPSVGVCLRCKLLLSSSATSLSTLSSMPTLQSKLRKPPAPAEPRNLRSCSCGTPCPVAGSFNWVSLGIRGR